MISVSIRLLSLSGDTMKNTIKKLAHMIINIPTEWRVRALNTVANLLELKVMFQ
jgi:radical SAM superfamily enzyme